LKKNNLDISLTFVRTGKFYKFSYVNDINKFCIWFKNKFGMYDVVNVYQKSTGNFLYQIK